MHCGIPDLYYDECPTAQISTNDIPPQKLYELAKDLETRINYFQSRFCHSLNFSKIGRYLENINSKVLELGCGTMQPLLKIGDNYPQQQVWGIDISWGHLLRAKETSPFTKLCRANATALPFEKEFFDIVWARHMLYDVKEPNKAIEQCKHSLCSQGLLCVSTNSAFNKPEMHQVHIHVLKQHGLPDSLSTPHAKHFSSEDLKDKLQPYFNHVIVLPYKGEFVFSNSDEFLSYYASTRYFKKIIARGLSRDSVLQSAERFIKDWPDLQVSNNGAVAIATDSLTRFRDISALI